MQNSNPKKCPECGTKFNPVLNYCPECETYHEDSNEEDIQDMGNDGMGWSQII